MKGKLVLSPIDKPVEGMQVLWNNEQCSVVTTGHKDIVLIDSDEEGRISVGLDELKQIMVEYEIAHERIATKSQKQAFYYPLHPSDWQWAISHIGEEVEFDKQEIYIGKPGNGFHFAGFWKGAKLIIPSPVVYTEKEVYDFCLGAAAVSKMMCAKNEMWSFDDWFNTNKKK
jgi:hypothetical protein